MKVYDLKQILEQLPDEMKVFHKRSDVTEYPALVLDSIRVTEEKIETENDE